MSDLPFDFWFLGSDPVGGLLVPLSILWFVLSLAVAKVARGQGRGTLRWFLMSIVVSPALGYVLVKILGHIESGRDHTMPLEPKRLRCPTCKKAVSPSLAYCVKCGEELPTPREETP